MGRIFKPRPKPAYSVKIANGAVIADFYADKNDIRNCYLHLYAPSGAFSHKVSGYSYGYLMAACQEGNVREIEAYCAMIWRITGEIYQDEELCKDIVAAINARDMRLEEEAREKAAEVTESQEEADQELMEAVARDAR